MTVGDNMGIKYIFAFSLLFYVVVMLIIARIQMTRQHSLRQQAWRKDKEANQQLGTTKPEKVKLTKGMKITISILTVIEIILAILAILV